MAATPVQEGVRTRRAAAQAAEQERLMQQQQKEQQQQQEQKQLAMPFTKSYERRGVWVGVIM